MRDSGETLSAGAGARIVNATGTLTVSPGACIDVNVIVSWWTTCESVSARSSTTMLSGAPPELRKSVSQGAVAVAFHERVAPSALASRRVAGTESLEPAWAESSNAAGVTTSRS